MPSWNKIHVLEGDPSYIHHMIKLIQEDLGNPEIVKYSNTTSAESIKSALMSFPFFEIPDLIVIAEPSADILKVCLECAESNFSASGLIVTCEHNTFDSRLSFISKASKNKRVSYYQPIQGSEIKKYIQDWACESKIKLEPDCYEWFVNNGPTTISKMKTPNGKKELIVHDLCSLDNFLRKLEVLNKVDKKLITIEDLDNYSNFSRESDIWIFIDNILSGKINFIYDYFEKNKITLSNHSILWLIASQLEFLLQIKNCLKTTKNINEISDSLSLSKLIGYYLNENFEPIENAKTKPQVNPYRLQMAIQTCNSITENDLVNKYQATISAIRDLRSGLDSDIVSINLTLAYSNKNNYLEPFLDV